VQNTLTSKRPFRTEPSITIGKPQTETAGQAEKREAPHCGQCIGKSVAEGVRPKDRGRVCKLGTDGCRGVTQCKRGQLDGRDVRGGEKRYPRSIGRLKLNFEPLPGSL